MAVMIEPSYYNGKQDSYYYDSYRPRTQTFEEKLKSELDKYFTQHVQLCRDEKKRAHGTTMPVIEQLAKYIHDQDPRFSKEVIKVGSSFQGLKVGDPDEYDVNIPLNGFNTYGWGPYIPRYYGIENVGGTRQGLGPALPPGLEGRRGIEDVAGVRLFRTSTPQPSPSSGYTFVELNSITPMWLNSNDLTYQGDVIPILVKNLFKKLLIQGIRNLNQRGTVRIDSKVHGPAVTLKIKTDKSLDFDISVDFSATISRAAPFPGCAGWPHPNTSWPSPQKKQIITNIGVSLVAKKDLQWMVSPGLAEKELMKGIDQPDECRRKAHRVMKKLNEDLWCPKGKAITSYALKNVMFWECEKFPDREHWVNEELATRVLSMTRYLHSCALAAKLPKYFVPTFNIFETKDDKEQNELRQAAGRVKAFLDDPLSCMARLNGCFRKN